ncbi:unnamed protein product [Urochloa humidicola]
MKYVAGIGGGRPGRAPLGVAFSWAPVPTRLELVADPPRMRRRLLPNLRRRNRRRRAWGSAAAAGSGAEWGGGGVGAATRTSGGGPPSHLDALPHLLARAGASSPTFSGGIDDGSRGEARRRPDPAAAHRPPRRAQPPRLPSATCATSRLARLLRASTVELLLRADLAATGGGSIQPAPCVQVAWSRAG